MNDGYYDAVDCEPQNVWVEATQQTLIHGVHDGSVWLLDNGENIPIFGYGFTLGKGIYEVISGDELNGVRDGFIIEVKVPTNMLDKVGNFTQVDGFIFKNGIITIQADKLEEFNKIIQEITHEY